MAAEGTSLLGRLSGAQQKWSQSANQMVDDVTRLARTFGVLSGALAFTLPLITRTGMTVAGLKGPAHIASALGLALGRVPAGAEGFPNVIKRIMQLSAAVSLFAASTGLIA